MSVWTSTETLIAIEALLLVGAALGVPIALCVGFARSDSRDPWPEGFRNAMAGTDTLTIAHRDSEPGHEVTHVPAAYPTHVVAAAKPWPPRPVALIIDTLTPPYKLPTSLAALVDSVRAVPTHLNLATTGPRHAAA